MRSRTWRVLAWGALLAALAGALTASPGTYAYEEATQAGPAKVNILSSAVPPAGMDPRPYVYCTAPPEVVLRRPATQAVTITCYNGFLSGLDFQLTATVLDEPDSAKPIVSPTEPRSMYLFGGADDSATFVIAADNSVAAPYTFTMLLSGRTDPSLSDVHVSFELVVPVYVSP